MRITYRSFGSLALAVGLGCGLVRAAPLMYDSFEDGVQGGLNGQNTGTGFSAAWGAVANAVVTSAVKLTYSNEWVYVDGGTNTMRWQTTSSSPAYSRAFPSQNANTLYFSCLCMSPTILVSDDDFYSWGFGTDNITDISVVKAGLLTRVANPWHPFGIRYGASSSMLPAPATVVASRTYFVVFKVWKSVAGPTKAYDRMALFVDPATTNEPAIASLTMNSTQAAAFSYFNCRTAVLETGDTYYLDELRIGTNYASVVPVLSSLATKTATPAASPNGGFFTNSVPVALSCATPAATIYYTTNGTTPTVSSPVYGGPLTLTRPTLLQAYATAPGYLPSDLMTKKFGFNQDLVAVDAFEDYAVGALSGLNGGAGFLDPYYAITGPTVAAYTIRYPMAGQQLGGGTRSLNIPANTAGPLIVRQFYPQNGNTLYLGFLFKLKTASGDTDDFLQLGLENQFDTAPNGCFVHRENRLALRVGANGESYSTVTTQVNRVYCIVVKFSKTTPGTAQAFNRMDLYVDPPSRTEPAVPTRTLSETMRTSFSHLIARNATMEAGDNYGLGHIRVGRTFSSALPPTLPNGSVVLVR